MKKLAAAALFPLVLLIGGARADVGGSLCPNAGIWSSFIFDSICWSCIFPVKALGGWIGDRENAPAGAANSKVCVCYDSLNVPQVGITTGAWHPTKLIENTRLPFCSPIMGGVRLADSFMPLGGQNTVANREVGKAFYNSHVFAFPILEILEMFVVPSCNPGGFSDFDLIMVSEIDPTWVDPELTMFSVPEAILFTSPLADLAAIPDCAMSSVGRPMDDLYWTMGCWGRAYPFSGHVSQGTHQTRDTSLVSGRMLALMHRRGMMARTVGEDTMCGAEFFPHIKKSQYKMSKLYPVPEAKGTGLSIADLSSTDQAPGPGGGSADPSLDYHTGTPAEQASQALPGSWGESNGCCHFIGESPFRWGESRQRPGKEDHLYLIFQWVDCCAK